MSETEHEILVVGARALAHADGLRGTLEAILDVVANSLEIESAAIVAGDPERGGLEIVASFGLDERSTAGLAEAIGRPGHPIARTFAAPASTFDVVPTQPGGPALRSHVPLTVTRGRTDTVLGVLALAHDQPIDPEMRPLIEAAADLAAVAIERNRA